MTKLRKISEHRYPEQLVNRKVVNYYYVSCACGKTWDWTTNAHLEPKAILIMMSEEYWVLNPEGVVQCPNCTRKMRQKEQRQPDPDNLGCRQRAVLDRLRRSGSWFGDRSGWLYDTPSNTKRILDSLVRRGLVREKSGVYKPT